MKIQRNILLILLLLVSVTVFAGKPAKYVFLMIGDGMGPEFCKLYLSQSPDSNFNKFVQRIPTGTNNVLGTTTDSAASGTALACGFKTVNRSIGVDKDGTPRSSLARRLQARDWKIGIISSVGINDATPAAHYANRLKRSDAAGILADLYASQYDFFGISTVALPPEFKTSDLNKFLKRNGYTVVKGKQLSTLKPGNRNVVISDTHAGNKPRLADVTAKAAELLSANGSSFFLMVEGGAIDHGNHRNDHGTALREMIEFDAAIGEALKFAEKHPEETLIIVTADHDTGGTKINDIAKYRKEAILKQTKSLNTLTGIVNQMKKNKATAADMIKTVSEAVGISALSGEENARIEAACQQFISGQQTKTDKFTASMGYGKYNPLVVEALRIRDIRNGFNYTSFGHTPAKPITFVKGAGAENFKAPQENSDIPHRIAAAAGFPGMLEKEGTIPPFPIRKNIADHVDLQTVTTDSATIRYGFNTAADRKFKLSNGTEKCGSGYFGRITFDNLKPDTEYTLTTPLKKPLKFRTQKEISGKLLFKAGVMSDPHLTCIPDNFGRMHSRSLELVSGVVKKFNADKMDFILVPGDLTDKGHPAEIETAREAFKNAKMPVLYTRGNHDHIRDASSKWIPTFGSPAGMVVHNGVQIVRLNIPVGILDTPENRALIEKIDEKMPVIIFTHYQLIPDNYVAAKDKSATIGETRGKKSIAEAPEGARKLLEKLSRCKGLLLVGHKNVAASVKLGGLTQINMPQTTEYPAGAVALEVYENGARLTFVPITDLYAEEYTRRRIAESSSRLRHRTRYSYPIWNSFVKF